ncbi:MAG: N-acetyl-gamma-glutamyl-phosphate reductase, partial [Acetobacterales bacterium]
AHRTAEGWAYGFPEYEQGHRERLRQAKRVANPGCYAITSVAMLHPLVSSGLLPADWPVTISAVSGYSGGGKPLIAAFEDSSSKNRTDSAFYIYGLNLQHKHLPEIMRWGGLAEPPVFVPSVGRFRQGMIVQLPLALWAIPGSPSAADLHAALTRHYDGERFVTVAPLADAATMASLDPEALNGTNELRLFVFHSADGKRAAVAGLIDNLGKGASGQAVQTLNLLVGADEAAGAALPAAAE